MSVQLQLGSTQTRLEGLTARVFAGRDPAACQLAFMDQTLSRRHAEIYVENSQCFIRDLGSANGTWIDGQHLGREAVALRPGQQIWLGHVPLGVTWLADGSQAVMAAELPDELRRAIAQRQAEQTQLPPTPTTSQPTPAEYAYRRQGHNDNGVLLLALPQDTFFSGADIHGFVEFTSLDRQTVASITVELLEFHQRGGSHGHAWDRVLVRQGPWRAEHGDVLPLPFTLRVPPGTAMSSRSVSWEIRATVDINWAVDIHASIPFTMRNPDIERLRDGLGAMDYRIEELESAALGQHFEGRFAPPAQLARDLGIDEIDLAIEYLGANMKIRMRLDRKGLHHAHAVDQTFELARLRSASQDEVNATLRAMLDQLLPK
ncbi:MAG TPA: FHA domain-containing protein [Kofleriaceae bacterium]|jgi:hypothetical protein